MADSGLDLGNVSALAELCEAQHKTIERLQQALAEHEEIEADRHMLKRMLAHELRTPLAAVIGALHLIAHPDLPEAKIAEMRERALRQAKQLNEMIDDVLTLADPHEASVDRTEQHIVGLSDLVDEVRDLVSAHVPPDLLALDIEDGVKIRTVPGRVRQILINLVVNAAKYGAPGEPISLSAVRLSEQVVFEIVDRGPGISPAKVEELFEPFRRGEGARGPGVGLGLFLARNLARSLGGTLELRPRDTGGTLARLSLPQKRIEDAVPSAAPAGLHLRVVSSPREETLQSR